MVSRHLSGGALFVAHDEDETSELRLRRSDIDAFESGIRRRRVILWAISIVLVLGGVAAALWYAMLREPPTMTVEEEPNDEPAQANRIPANVAVHGYLGKRRTPNEGDRDTFLVGWPSGSRRVVTVRVSAPPNIDVVLGVTTGAGLHHTTIDEAGLGQGEVMHRRRIEGPLIVSVGQQLANGAPYPTENVSDPYELQVIEEVAEAGEIEPNGIEADANLLQPTVELRGYLDTHDDLDLLRWMGPSGTYIVVVRADGVPVQWRTGDGKARTPGEARLALTQGELIRIERTERTDPGKQAVAGRDATWSIVVVR